MSVGGEKSNECPQETHSEISNGLNNYVNIGLQISGFQQPIVLNLLKKKIVWKFLTGKDHVKSANVKYLAYQIQ